MELQFSLETIHEAAARFWELTKNATVFAFHGEMGAGKTTFIHALCEVKRVEDVISSPTFSIINEYDFIEENTTRKIYHIDLYRLRDEEEAIRAGVEDCLYSGEICLVEWPERAVGIFPENTLHIYIALSDSGFRKLKIGDN